jgi:ubiquinol-cytochrome c reductase cytochrome b subunit
VIAKWLRERTGSSEPLMMPGGPSIAYVFGTVLLALLLVEGLTGIALAMFYSPSSTDAWASVAYIQDQASMGWFVRGLHYHGASALVIITGIHLLQTAVAGAYKKPREVVWWLGIVLLLLVLVWSVTGYWLRWDQAAFWAAKVEVGIMSGAPGGGFVKSLALGGNDTGNLTLTRAYAMHVGLISALFVLVTYVHIKLARRHGTTPVKAGGAPTLRWPAQSIRDAVATAIVMAVLIAYVATTGGVALAAPADPGTAFDARPLWPFRWLFELRALAGSAEVIAALAAPAVFGGFLVALPLLDRSDSREPKKRMLWLGGLAGLFAMVGALTVMSFARDANDPTLDKRLAIAEKQAATARRLAAEYGVPATGPLDVYEVAPFSRAKKLFEQRCSGCHGAMSEKRKGPTIADGHGNRAWLAGFLKAPNGDAFWGRTKLAKDEAAMQPVTLGDSDAADLVEWLYAQNGATDLDAKMVERGLAVFDKTCTDCHSRDEGVSGTGPALAGLNSRDYYMSFISNPKSGIHMGVDHSQMPRFDKELSLADRDAIAAYLVSLRSAK